MKTSELDNLLFYMGSGANVRHIRSLQIHTVTLDTILAFINISDYLLFLFFFILILCAFVIFIKFFIVLLFRFNQF